MSINEFELALKKSSPQTQSTAVQTTIGRHTQDIQGLVFMAKQYPRNQFDSWKRIKEACSRKSLAEVASYTYPRGGERITGPSIRLAEVLAQNWGNLSTGVVELEQKVGESVCMAFAWDLETNFRDEKIFTVKHERETKKGIKKLDSPRDITKLLQIWEQGGRGLVFLPLSRRMLWIQRLKSAIRHLPEIMGSRLLIA